MAYIGNEPTSAAFVTDLFSGNGTTVAFTMAVSPATPASVLIAISGVVQSPDTYSISGTTLTFSAAPPAGTGNISVRYLGVPATNVTTTAYRTVTEFTATANQTTFSVPSYTVGYIDVYRNGVRLGAADYTATNGTSVILANAATVGDLVTTESFYVSSVLNAIPATGGAVNNIYLDSGNANGTGALRLPVGTTAQRPTGTAGFIRQNSTTGNPEWWDATTSTWLQFSQPAGYSVSYLIVAGAGGGGGAAAASAGAGGGGAGGMLLSNATLSSGTAYTVTVGAGGPGGIGGQAPAGTNGSNSSISTINTAIGGGGGGTCLTGSFANGAAGSGGSGGGGEYYHNSGAPGSGTTGQGFAGGTGSLSSSNFGGGGGGGASTAGINGTSTAGGNGGAGSASTISGSSVTYAGGGGAGVYGTGTSGLGGSGGGGNGGTSNGGTGSAGTANTGGGGGGGSTAGSAGSYNGGAGGSGIVIISYYGSQRGSGGTVTSSGGYTIHTFTSSGTYNA